MNRRALNWLMILVASLGTASAFAFPGPERAPGSGHELPGQPPKRSYLGAKVVAVTPERAKAIGLKNAFGVEVTVVDQDAPAGKAGVQEGDIIFSLNGNRVDSKEQLLRIVHQVPPGQIVSLGIYRFGQEMNLRVTMADRTPRAPADSIKPQNANSRRDPPLVQFPPIEGTVVIFSQGPRTGEGLRTGLVLDELTPEGCQYLGIKNGRGGLLVSGIRVGSPADQAGVQPGDVVVQVEKEWISDLDDWQRIVGRRNGPTTITVVRKKHEKLVTIKLPPDPR